MDSSSTRNWVRGRPIGRGSFGTVSLAFRDPGGEAFAVKSVDLNLANPAAVLALNNEIEILKSLSSPYVVRYLGDDTSVDAPSGACRNLHLEYLPRGTVADLAAARMRKRSCGVEDEHDVRVYARCVARALRYLHEVAGVVHCDIKGRNVLLGRAPGVAKLADFGAAVRISDGVGGDGRNWVRGTPLWMAPEVARGERPRPASDVWSLGCTVIEMATGAQPWSSWRSKDAEEAMFHIAYSDEVPEFPPLLSKLGRDFLDNCLRRDASQRWTAEQLLQHPFLAEAEVAMEQTPRGVLDWPNWEFRGSDNDDGGRESCSVSYSSIAEAMDWVNGGRERVRELASCWGGFGWDSDGWEEVRREEEPNLAGDETEEVLVDRGCGAEEEGTCWKYANSCSVELEMKDGNLSVENEGRLPSGMGCSVSSPTNNSSTSFFCKSALACHHVNRVLFFARCVLLFQQLMEINGIPSFLSPSFGFVRSSPLLSLAHSGFSLKLSHLPHPKFDTILYRLCGAS